MTTWLTLSETRIFQRVWNFWTVSHLHLTHMFKQRPVPRQRYSKIICWTCHAEPPRILRIKSQHFIAPFKGWTHMRNECCAKLDVWSLSRLRVRCSICAHIYITVLFETCETWWKNVRQWGKGWLDKGRLTRHLGEFNVRWFWVTDKLRKRMGDTYARRSKERCAR